MKNSDTELQRANFWIKKNIKPEYQTVIKDRVFKPARLMDPVELYDAIY